MVSAPAALASITAMVIVRPRTRLPDREMMAPPPLTLETARENLRMLAVVGQTQRPSDLVPRAHCISPPHILRRVGSFRLASSRAVLRACLIGVAAVLATPRTSGAQTGQMCAARIGLPPDSLEVRDVRFVDHGKHSNYTSSQLGRLVGTRATGLFRRFVPLDFVGARRTLNCQQLRADSAELTAYYTLTGYPGTIVRPSVTATGARAVAVEFAITEMPPMIIDSVTLAWENAPTTIDTADLRRRLYSQVGRVHDVTRVRLDRDTIERALKNHGYLAAEALISESLIASTRRTSVSIRVVPGALVRFGAITITSTPRDHPNDSAEIRPEAVRPLLGFKTGDLYSQDGLLDAQRRIHLLGTYLAVTPTRSRLIADPAHPGDSIADLSVRLLEDKVHSLGFDPGFNNVDCFRVNVQYTNRGFRRTTRRLDVGAQASKIGWGRPLATDWTRNTLCSPDAITNLFGDALVQDSVGSSKLNYALNVTLAQPGSFGGMWVPQVSLYSERKSGYQAYLRETLAGAAASVSRSRSRLTLGGGYNLEYGHTDAEPAVLCFVFTACDEDAREALTGSNRISAIASLNGTRDRLNDPVIRTRGTLMSAELRTANRWLGSHPSLTFNKASVDAAWYRPLFNRGQNVLHARLRAGIIGGGAKTDRDRLPPPQERFYAGGANSVRAFQENELGSLVYTVDSIVVTPTASGADTVAVDLPRRVIPVGGNSLIVANLEYRVPGPVYPNVLQTVFFLDVGRVWTRGVPEAVRFRWAPGVGLRASTGVGPIQVNVGYNHYDRPAGPAYLNKGLSGGPAPLICVSPKDPTSTASCPATYVPRTSHSFWKRLTLTLSISQ
jgi:outer membrane protein assembly factor BamA